MTTKKTTHKINILKVLLETQERLTATDFTHISNPNQYFVELEHQGFIKSEWGFKGNSKVKFRFVADDTREKAMQFLKSHSTNGSKRVN